MRQIQYAVFHMQKGKKGDNYQGISAHIERRYVANDAIEKQGFDEILFEGEQLRLRDILGRHIDPNRTHLNEINGDLPLPQAVKNRIQEGHTIVDPRTGKIETIKKNAVEVDFLMLTGSHERMMEIYEDKQLFKEWKQANYDWVCREFGEDNIAQWAVHVDEYTPHIHCAIVPINEKGRLSHESFFGGGHKLRRLVDRYSQAMNPFGLRRGIHKEITKAVHKDTAIWRIEQAVKGIQSLEEAQKLTQDINWTSAILGNMAEIRQEQTFLVSDLIRQNSNLQEKKAYAEQALNTSLNATQARIYQQALRGATGQKLDWIKRHIEIGPFLKERGWKEDQLEGTIRNPVLVHPITEEKIIVPVDPDPNGQRIFHYPDGGVGTLIDILKKEEWQMEDILKLAHSVALHHVQKDDPSKLADKAETNLEPEQARQKAQMHFDAIVKAHGQGFLEKCGIEKRVYTSFEELKVGRLAAVFQLYNNFDKDGKADLCSTITYREDQDGNSTKYFQKGLHRGMAMLADPYSQLHEARRIVVTNSPIDALSYRQLELRGWLHAENRHEIGRTVFLSTCGNLTAQIKDDLHVVFQMAAQNGQKLVLALNNDLEGKKMTETLVHLAQQADCEYFIEKPNIGKDWNDLLCLKNVQEPGHNPELLAEDRWQIFQETAYEHSLFEKLAFEKETFQAFKDNLKSGEKTMMVALKQIGQEAISATWHLELNARGRFKEVLEGGPPLSVLKGDIKEATELVLVNSPIEALVHYQTLKDEAICYVQVNMAEKSKLERPLSDLVEQENWNHIMVASVLKNQDKANNLAQFLQEEKIEAEHLHLDVSNLVKASAQKMGIEKETIEAFKEKTGAHLEGKQDQVVTPSQDKQEKHANKSSSLSVIKADVKQAEKVVLVATKWDAMLHYQGQIKQGGQDKTTCYVLANVTQKDGLKDSIEKLKIYAQNRAIDISIAASKDNMYAAKRIQNTFKEESMRVYNERLKREVDLSAFLQKELGCKKDIDRSSQNNDVLIRPTTGEKIIVPNQPKENGHRVFSYENGQAGGTIIDLLFEEKWSWRDISKLAQSKFLPKIEEIEHAVGHPVGQKQENTHSSRSQQQEIDSTSRAMSIGLASTIGQGLDLLSSLISVGINANRYAGQDYHQEEIEREREEEEQKKKKRKRSTGISF